MLLIYFLQRNLLDTCVLKSRCLQRGGNSVGSITQPILLD